jgi:hypothetical protein
MMQTYFYHPTLSNNSTVDRPLYGAVLDARGCEIPITEQMILDACKALEPISSSIYTREITGINN